MEKLIKQSKEVSISTSLYWKLRCKYLEKTLDNTYSITERNNCRILYDNLRKREK